MSDYFYVNLLNQLDKLSRHNRCLSYKTRARYYEAGARFVRFLADRYHLQNLRNVSAKHLVSYVEDMQARGLSPSTIKTELAAIRFWHDLTPRARYRLPQNDELGIEIERRRYGGVDRTWSREELEGFCRIARNTGHGTYAKVFATAWHTGLRAHEVLRIDTAMARAAIKTGELLIKGKSGLERTIKLSEIAKELLKQSLAGVSPGSKLYVEDGVPTHLMIKRIEAFIYEHRDEVSAPGREAPLTLHGCRHSFAAREYAARVSAGMDERDAKREVSELLGHHRPEVTNIYISSVDKEGSNCKR